jgi:hypothetical protein
MDLVRTGANAGRAWSPIGHVPAEAKAPRRRKTRERKPAAAMKPRVNH